MNAKPSIACLNRDEMERIHRASLEILRNPGMKIMEKSLLQALQRAGAKVDLSAETVSFPAPMVEEAIASMKASVRKPTVLNGVVASLTDGRLAAKFGGACCLFHDWEKNESREPSKTEVINMLRLGEAIPEVRHVGNPLLYMREDDGKPIPPSLRPIKTSALVARHTSKPYTCEVWSPESLEFQIEIGCVVKGSWEAYKADPVFITAKETISPLTLPHDDARVLIALAKKDLPCTVIPMPLSSATCPVTQASNVAMANAEILGCMTALRCLVPECRFAGGVISGVMDMASGNALFAAPEPILQDMALSQLHQEFYGFDLGIGTGYIDACHPGAQSAAEKTLKITAAFFAGKTNYPVGILAGGKTFCPEEAMLELEIAKTIHKLYGGLVVNDETLAVDVIQSVGIAGNFLAHDHTLKHFREALLISRIFDRSAGAQEDVLKRANRMWKEILATAVPYALPEDKGREIARIVAKAEKFFTA